MIVVLAGVSGSGKTTVGRMLADDLGWRFIDGDDYHPLPNIKKMQTGIPLTDSDRRPWLETLRKLIIERVKHGESAVVACSALKKEYRNFLCQNLPSVRFVHLRGNYDLIAKRLRNRPKHFFRADLLKNQFEILEAPHEMPEIDISQDPATAVADVRNCIGL